MTGKDGKAAGTNMILSHDYSVQEEVSKNTAIVLYDQKGIFTFKLNSVQYLLV